MSPKPTAKCTIKQLQEQDWELWKDIRLEALQLHPEAFGIAYEEEVVRTEEDFRKALIKSDIFGALINGKLISIAAFSIYELQKLRHKGALFALYVRKEHQNQGRGTQLLETVIHHAQTRVLQLHCSVNTGNQRAIKLYRKHGFQIFGTEPRALKVGDTFHDLHLMALRFD